MRPPAEPSALRASGRPLGFDIDAVIPRFWPEPDTLGGPEHVRMPAGLTLLYH